MPRWRPFRALFVANLKGYLRNPLPASGLMIVLILLLAGVRFLEGVQARPANVAVVDLAGTPAAASLIAGLRSYPSLHLTLTGSREAARRVASGAADVEVVVPRGLGDAGPGGRPKAAVVAVNFHDGASGSQAADLIAAAVDTADREAQHAPRRFSVARHAIGGGSGLLALFLPGVLVFNVINAGLIFAAGIFAGYRSTGALRRIQATGTRPAELVLAHAASNLTLASGQVLIMLIAAMAIFEEAVPFGGLLGVSMLCYLVFLAIGLAVSGWVRDPQRAPVVASAIAFPLIFAALLPVSGAAGPAGALLAVLPATMATDAMRHIVGGDGASTYLTDVGGLAAWALAALVAASRVFRWDR